MVSSPMESIPADRTPQRTDLSGLQGLDLQSRYHSSRSGGDFFDAISVGSRVVFFLTDIAGKKKEAHTIAAKTQDIFRARAAEIFGAPDTNLMDATAELVHVINHALIQASNGVHYAPTFVGCFDMQLGILAYINAGGQSAVFSEADGTRPLGNVTVPMGLFSHFTYEPSMQAFEPEAKLLIVTKGVTDGGAEGHTEFGVEKLIRLVQGSAAKSAAELCEETLQAAYEVKKAPWYLRLLGRGLEPEDMTVLAMVRHRPISLA
jgi:serine phosphatase RsbU (regulator of sigma subunit)